MRAGRQRERRRRRREKRHVPELGAGGKLLPVNVARRLALLLVEEVAVLGRALRHELLEALLAHEVAVVLAVVKRDEGEEDVRRELGVLRAGRGHQAAADEVLELLLDRLGPEGVMIQVLLVMPEEILDGLPQSSGHKLHAGLGQRLVALEVDGQADLPVAGRHDGVELKVGREEALGLEVADGIQVDGGVMKHKEAAGALAAGLGAGDDDAGEQQPLWASLGQVEQGSLLLEKDVLLGVSLQEAERALRGDLALVGEAVGRDG
jgi:hypothetical protein